MFICKQEKEFHVYEQYCANYKNAQTISFELEKDDKVKELVAVSDTFDLNSRYEVIIKLNLL